MKFLPYHSFKLKLPYDKKQAIARIFENTEANSFGKTHSETKTFIGTLSDNGFTIKKGLKQSTKNSFTPIAIGELQDDGYYCQLAIRMRPPIFTLVFMLIWIAYFIKVTLELYNATSSISLLYLGFILFGYLLMYFAFWHEVPEAENAIKQILGVNEIAD